MPNPVQPYDVPKVPTHEDIGFSNGGHCDVQHVVSELWSKNSPTFVCGQEFHGLAGYQKDLGTYVNQLVVDSATRFGSLLNFSRGDRRQYRSELAAAKSVNQPIGPLGELRIETTSDYGRVHVDSKLLHYNSLAHAGV